MTLAVVAVAVVVVVGGGDKSAAPVSLRMVSAVVFASVISILGFLASLRLF